MGANVSTQPELPAKASTKKQSEVFNEKMGYFDLNQHLRGLSLDVGNYENTDKNPISTESLDTWETKLLADPKNVLAQNAFAKNAIVDVIGTSNSETLSKDKYLFNVEVETIGSPSYFNNQNASGRCWIFATSNILRTHVIKRYNLKPDHFQVSQSYLFFYDKLEKANFFLDNIIDTTEEPLDSRLIQYLFQAPVSDGGQWDMIVNLVTKYGIVPHELFPDSAQASASSRLNYIVTEKLREFALILRGLLTDEATSEQDIKTVKQSMMKEIYNIIALSLGTPPKPTDSFTWEFIDKDGTFKSFETNPIDFYKTHVKFDAAKHFSLIHDPRNPYEKLYTVDRLNNISNGKPIEYVNLELSVIKKTAIKMLKKNEPIFFGSDVGKFSNSQSGILDTGAYDYELGFGTSLKINKEERLRTGSSQMTHAMVITGVHLDKAGVPVRWKIENSWGDAVGEKGYFLMTDAWFDEYVFQIVTNEKFVDPKTFNIWTKKEYSVLPFFDPMGALA
ncbi:cysteine proteinase 1, mitochondrial [[Candida] anglica]|uniref:Cysteine proteinase 1, mitochondrial n=1 Tax=[Candida] anglica TaxID=148631 RepID=A0ABP0EH66_9ASCO